MGKTRHKGPLRVLLGFSISRPTQLLEKSHQLFGDVEFLFNSGRDATAIYLSGFVIELMLQAKLFDRRLEPHMATLIYRSHDLDALMAECSVLENDLSSPVYAGVRASFMAIKSWSVRLRYNPKRPSRGDATVYRRHLNEVRNWLNGRI